MSQRSAIWNNLINSQFVSFKNADAAACKTYIVSSYTIYKYHNKLLYKHLIQKMQHNVAYVFFMIV
jgi:hypothetical protein